MVGQRSLVLLAAIFAIARSQAPVARYLRGEGREDEEAPALHYFATDDPELPARAAVSQDFPMDIFWL